jgi:hypothetical protein
MPCAVLWYAVLCCCAQVTRHVFDQSAGKTVPQSEVLEVPIKPGWKAGTKITYAGVCSWLCAQDPRLSTCRSSSNRSKPGAATLLCGSFNNRSNRSNSGNNSSCFGLCSCGVSAQQLAQGMGCMCHTRQPGA